MDTREPSPFRSGAGRPHLTVHIDVLRHPSAHIPYHNKHNRSELRVSSHIQDKRKGGAFQ